MTKPHDELFKATLTPQAARQLCKAVLPAEAGVLFDQATLVREPETFVEGALASDVLYRAEFTGGAEALVYVLFEHQSTVDPLMAYRVLRYMVRIWGRWLRSRRDQAPRSLPPILPIVVYHGESEWSAPLDFRALVRLPQGLAADGFVPSFRYVLDDLSRIREQEIRARHAPPEAALAWIFLGQAYAPARGVEVLHRSLDLLAELIAQLPSTRELVERFLAYSLVVGFGEVSDLSEALGRLGGEGLEEFLMTAGERLLERGRDEGARRLFLKLLAPLGPLSEAIRDRIDHASLEELESWTERLASGERPPEVFGTTPR